MAPRSFASNDEAACAAKSIQIRMFTTAETLVPSTMMLLEETVGKSGPTPASNLFENKSSHRTEKKN